MSLFSSLPPGISNLVERTHPLDHLNTPIEEQERQVRLDMESRIQQCRSMALICKEILQVQNHPGFKSFCNEVQKLRDEANRGLIKAIDSNQMRMEQGKVIAFDAILTIMNRQEASLQRVAEDLAKLENQYKKQVTSDGRLRPIGAIP